MKKRDTDYISFRLDNAAILATKKNLLGAISTALISSRYNNYLDVL